MHRHVRVERQKIKNRRLKKQPPAIFDKELKIDEMFIGNYVLFKISVHFVNFTRIGEGRALRFQEFQKLSNLTFSNNTNQQRFIRMRVHT